MGILINVDGSITATNEVNIIGSITWGIDNGYYTKQDGFCADMPDMFTALKGHTEYIIEAPDHIIAELKTLPNNSFLPIRLKSVLDYLKQNNIPYTIDGNAPKL